MKLHMGYFPRLKKLPSRREVAQVSQPLPNLVV